MEKRQSFLQIILENCKHENWRYWIFDREKSEVNFFRQELRIGFMISKKLQDLHVDCVFYHDVEVDLACEELDEVYDFLYLNYKEEVERMIEGEGEEEALQAQRDLETHLNHHRL